MVVNGEKYYYDYKKNKMRMHNQETRSFNKVLQNRKEKGWLMNQHGREYIGNH